LGLSTKESVETESKWETDGLSWRMRRCGDPYILRTLACWGALSQPSNIIDLPLVFNELIHK
jgi:hypothetical protein